MLYFIFLCDIDLADQFKVDTFPWLDNIKETRLKMYSLHVGYNAIYRCPGMS